MLRVQRCHRMYAKINVLFQRLCDVVFPRTCPLTGEPLGDDEGGHYVSAKGLQEIQFVISPCCQTCGAPFYGEMVGKCDCIHCKELTAVFKSGRTLFLLSGGGRRLVHNYKYNGAQWLLADFERFAEHVPGYLDHLRNGTLVPVPLYKKRERKRGFNQSLLLAERFARAASGETCVQELLVRTRNTPSQTRMNREERLKNIDGAFTVHPQAIIEKGRRYIIVDDVFTTGATLNACAEALRDAGAENIHIATLAHG